MLKNSDLQATLEMIEESKAFTDEVKASLLHSLRKVDKELDIVNFKLDRTEKVKKTTAILLEETIEELEQKRKAVEETNAALKKSMTN